MGEPITLYKPNETTIVHGKGQLAAFVARGWSLQYLPTVEQGEKMESAVIKNSVSVSYILDSGGISDSYIEKLIAAGFDTAEKLEAASIDDISAIRGIGKKTAVKIAGIFNVI